MKRISELTEAEVLALAIANKLVGDLIEVALRLAAATVHPD